MILPHNQYLALMVDHGIIGGIILPLLILAVMWGAQGENRWVALIFCGAALFLGFFTRQSIYGIQHHSVFFDGCVSLRRAAMAKARRRVRSGSIRRRSVEVGDTRVSLPSNYRLARIVILLLADMSYQISSQPKNRRPSRAGIADLCMRGIP